MRIWNAEGREVEFPLHITDGSDMFFVEPDDIPMEAKLRLPELANGAVLFFDGMEVLFQQKPPLPLGGFSLL